MGYSLSRGAITLFSLHNMLDSRLDDYTASMLRRRQLAGRLGLIVSVTTADEENQVRHVAKSWGGGSHKFGWKLCETYLSSILVLKLNKSNTTTR